MFDPSWEGACKSCSFWADGHNGFFTHLKQRDVTFVAVSLAPLEKLTAFKRRMGWNFKWVSSLGSDFNRDFQVSETPEEKATGQAYYNYNLGKPFGGERPGIGVFCRDDDGAVFHTYSCYARGLDMLNGAYHYLDLTPKGRDEDGLSYPMTWVRLHDLYGGLENRLPAPLCLVPPADCAARLGRGALRLAGGGRGDAALQAARLEAEPAVGRAQEIGIDPAIMLDGADAAGGEAYAHRGAEHVGEQRRGLQVGQEAPLRLVVGVAHIVADQHALARDEAPSRHDRPRTAITASRGSRGRAGSGFLGQGARRVKSGAAAGTPAAPPWRRRRE
jgi:hypothetical protein